MKKCYVANLVESGVLVGSVILQVWFWQSALTAHKKMSEAVEIEHGIVDFRRVS